MWPAIIAAGGSLLGGLLGQSGQDKDRRLQTDAMKKSIQWKVADAKAAGIHPLAALGAPTYTPSPVSVGGPNMASAVADMGQNIGRAVDAASPSSVRARNLDARIMELQVSNMELQNAKLASDIAVSRQAGQPPARPESIIGNVVRPGEVGPNEYPLFGINWRTGSDATAEQIERDYGDFAQNIYGTGRAVKDFAQLNIPSWVDNVDGAIKSVVLNALSAAGRPFVAMPSGGLRFGKPSRAPRARGRR